MKYLLHHGLEGWADSEPDRVALVDRGRTLTYGELQDRAGRLARLLRDLGVSRGDRVGLYLDKSIESVIGIYGTLKAGAAYVPLDPQAPPTRLGYIVGDCGIRCLLTGAEMASKWGGLYEAGSRLEHLVVLNADRAEGSVPSGTHVTTADALEAHDPLPADTRAIGQDLAYILYTSGSTGVPKGVMLSHTNGLAFVEWAASEFGVRPGDRLSSHAPLHFDLSIFDLFAASCGGAAVHLVPPETSYFPSEVGRFIEEERITIWYSVPSVLNMLVQRGNLGPGRFPELRTILFAGEVFPIKYLRRLMRLIPHPRFVNLYGPTETNVCTWYEVPPIPESRTEPIPIGRSIEGVEVFAVRDDGGRCGPGQVGELHVRGPTVMQGYWGETEQTSRSLAANPFVEQSSERVYRTGDLVEELPDGNFRLLGRRDHQIKSRGYRIELGDIETALYAHPSIVECAVIAVPDELVTNRIKAYVVVREDIDRAELVRFCRTRLPKHMIPETFDFRGALPKTSTGKIDRQELASSETTAGREHRDRG